MLIKTMLKNFFTAFSHPRIFSHVVFKGKLYTKDRRYVDHITNIVDLLQYIVLPYYTEIPEQTGMNIFLKGLAKLEIDKSLIVNGRVLTMLAHKQPLHDVDTQSDKSEKLLRDHFLRQQRGGNIAVYRGARMQRGYGIGVIFKSLARYAIALFKQGAKVVGKRALQAATEVGQDVLQGKNVRESVETHGGKVVKDFPE